MVSNDTMSTVSNDTMSKASKEVMIKVVAQAIPTYTMSCFKIPDSFCDEMISLIRNFW